jgi:hypothetical protein
MLNAMLQITRRSTRSADMPTLIRKLRAADSRAEVRSGCGEGERFLARSAGGRADAVRPWSK